MPQERVQKILAQAGIASRRKAEELITEGVVTINGRVAKLGDKAELGSDSIKVRGKLLHGIESKIYIAFNKPRGVISMLADPDGRATIAEFITSVKTRVFPVGRLDFNSEGIILLTNDGDMAEKIQKNDQILRVFSVKVKGHPTDEMVERLKKGAKMAQGFFKPHSVRLLRELENKSQIEIVTSGSGTVDLKAYFEFKGLLVERIARIAIGHMNVRGLKPGHFKYLKVSQVESLIQQPELAMRVLAEGEEKSAKKSAARARAAKRLELHEEKRNARAGAPFKTNTGKIIPRGEVRPRTSPSARPARPRSRPAR